MAGSSWEPAELALQLVMARVLLWLLLIVRGVLDRQPVLLLLPLLLLVLLLFVLLLLLLLLHLHRVHLQLLLLLLMVVLVLLVLLLPPRCTGSQRRLQRPHRAKGRLPL